MDSTYYELPPFQSQTSHKGFQSGLQVRATSHTQHGSLDPYRLSAGPSIGPSLMSSAPSKGSLTQKKDGGFRATLRRVFGSKRTKSSLQDTRKNYHFSDPGNLISSADEPIQGRVSQEYIQPKSVTRASAPGLPISRGRIQSQSDGSPKHNRLQSTRRRRRNTLPSIILTEQEAEIFTKPFLSNEIPAKLQDLTRSSGAVNDTHIKRRSRSADALNAMAVEIPAVEIPAVEKASVRDREDEIAYWRRSIIENPIPILSGQLAENPSYIHQTETIAGPKGGFSPLQNFDFGLDKPSDEPITLEQRVNTLEVKLFDFEYALAKLQGNDIPKPVIYTKPSKRRSIHDLFPNNATKSTLALSSSLEPASTTSSSSPSELEFVGIEEGDMTQYKRASKATTIRPLTARRSSPQRLHNASPSSIRMTSSQFDELIDLIKQEQRSRQTLERQVAELQKEVDILKAPVYATIRPLPNSNSSPGYNQETPRPLHRSPGFQIDKNPNETSRFSMTDQDSDTDDGYQEFYETPQESKFSFGSPRSSPLVGVV